MILGTITTSDLKTHTYSEDLDTPYWQFPARGVVYGAITKVSVIVSHFRTYCAVYIGSRSIVVLATLFHGLIQLK
jgi:hypothetical protein